MAYNGDDDDSSVPDLTDSSCEDDEVSQGQQGSYQTSQQKVVSAVRPKQQTGKDMRAPASSSAPPLLYRQEAKPRKEKERAKPKGYVPAVTEAPVAQLPDFEATKQAWQEERKQLRKLKGLDEDTVQQGPNMLGNCCWESCDRDAAVKGGMKRVVVVCTNGCRRFMHGACWRVFNKTWQLKADITKDCLTGPECDGKVQAVWIVEGAACSVDGFIPPGGDVDCVKTPFYSITKEELNKWRARRNRVADGTSSQDSPRDKDYEGDTEVGSEYALATEVSEVAESSVGEQNSEEPETTVEKDIPLPSDIILKGPIKPANLDEMAVQERSKAAPSEPKQEKKQKKKYVSVPVDIRYADARAEGASDYYYDEWQESSTGPVHRSQQKLSIAEFPTLNQAAQQPARKTDDGVPEFEPDLIMDALNCLRLTISDDQVSAHLLVECIDIERLLAKGNKVDVFFKQMFGEYGNVIHFRIFTKQDAAAVSFDQQDAAIKACTLCQNALIERKKIKICFLRRFPNDDTIAEVCPEYGGRASKKVRQPTSPPPALVTAAFQPFTKPFNNMQRHGARHSPLHNGFDARSSPSQDHKLPRYDAETDSYNSSAPKSNYITSPGRDAPSKADGAIVPMRFVRNKSVEQLNARSAAPAQPPLTWLQQLLVSYQALQITGCTTELLDSFYSQHPRFRLEASTTFFRDPDAIVTRERTLLVFYNYKNSCLEGCWHALTVINEDAKANVEFELLERLPSLTAAAWEPVLASYLRPKPVLPIKLVGAEMADLLQVFATARERRAVTASSPSSNSPASFAMPQAASSHASAAPPSRPPATAIPPQQPTSVQPLQQPVQSSAQTSLPYAPLGAAGGPAGVARYAPPVNPAAVAGGRPPLPYSVSFPNNMPRPPTAFPQQQQQAAAVTPSYQPAVPAARPLQPAAATPAGFSNGPPLPTPFERAASSPLPTAAPAAAPTGEVSRPKRVCPLCNVNSPGYLNKECRHLGPCHQCLPSKDAWQSLYPRCSACDRPASSLFKIIL